MSSIEDLARRRMALLAQREDIDAEIKNIDAQLIDAVEVGGHVDVDGQPRCLVAEGLDGRCGMSEWTGMHNPEQHKVEDGDDFTGCSGCFEECSADWPCRCCIAAEVERLTAERDALAALCEQQTKDRSLYSDDREKYDLSYIDGWNDALDLVEQALRGERDKLKKQLAEIEAQIKGAAPAAPKVDWKAVRAWAEDNGYEVPKVGRFGQPIVDAYNQAHGGGAA